MANQLATKGLAMKKKLPIKKRTSMSAGTSSYDSDMYSNSRLEVASTVSSSDLEGSHTTFAESLLQPLPPQRQLQPIRTVAGIHAPATAAQVRLDEKASQGWYDNSSGSLRGTQHPQHDAASAAQAHMHQPSDDTSSPRKLAIRRGPQATPCSHNNPPLSHAHAQAHFHSLFPPQRQAAPTTIIEEPCEADASYSTRRPHQQATSTTSHTSAYMGYRHSISSPASKMPPSPEAEIRPEHLNRFEFGDVHNGHRAWGGVGDGGGPPQDQLHFGSHIASSPRGGAGASSPQKLAIRRSNQPARHAGPGVCTPVYLPACLPASVPASARWCQLVCLCSMCIHVVSRSSMHAPAALPWEPES